MDVNPNNIIRILKRKGINPRRADWKLFLTAANANLRLEFAIHFMNKTRCSGKVLFLQTKKHLGNFKFNF
jgi:hypothetical protein